MQSTGDVAAAVQLMQEALELDEKCEFAYETLGTIGELCILMHTTPCEIRCP